MCLTIDIERHGVTVPFTALADIFLAKCLSVRSCLSPDGMLVPKLLSPFQEYEWKVGVEQPKVSLNPDNETRYNLLTRPIETTFNVFEGYHAFQPSHVDQIIEAETRYDGKCYSKFYLVKIPKGTKYFMGTCEDIVAEQMILVNDTVYTAEEIKEKITPCV